MTMESLYKVDIRISLQRYLREAAKKSYFLSGPATKALAPPPGLVAIGTFSLTLFFFSLSGIPV